MKLANLLVGVTMLAACKYEQPSETKYATFTFGRDRIRAMSMLDTIDRQGYIDISLQYQGMAATYDQDQAMRQNIARAIREWTGALDPASFPKNRPIVRIGCCGSHTVIVNPAVTRSYALPEQKTIYLAGQYINQFDPNSYRTILHEVGHLMGLADTYSEPGRQQPIGQPDSVMNYVYSHDQLQQDDIFGIRALWEYMRYQGPFCRYPYGVGGAYENKGNIAFCVPQGPLPLTDRSIDVELNHELAEYID
jgi:hypothetical protein